MVVITKAESFSVYGNSISTYEGYIPIDYLTWFTPSKMKVEETWWWQVGESMGWTLCNNSSWSGSRVAYDRDWDYKSYFISPHRLLNLSQNGIPDNILVLGGVNDWRWSISSLGVIESTDSTEFCGAYKLMLDRLRELYPQANIYCFSILPIYEKGYTENSLNSRNWSIIDANCCIKDICALKGVSFIDMHNCEFSNNVLLYTEDGLHPNVIGMHIIAEFVSARIKELKTQTTLIERNPTRFNMKIEYQLNGIIGPSRKNSVSIFKDANNTYKKIVINK